MYQKMYSMYRQTLDESWRATAPLPTSLGYANGPTYRFHKAGTLHGSEVCKAPIQKDIRENNCRYREDFLLMTDSIRLTFVLHKKQIEMNTENKSF